MKRIIFFSMPVLLAGCAAGGVNRPVSSAPLIVPETFPSARSGGAAVDLGAWWGAFDDPALSDLISRALKANPDIDGAGARLRQARAQLGQAAASLLPSVTASGGSNRNQALIGGGGGSTGFQAGFDASWEADVFGGNRRAMDASRADAASALADLLDVQRAITAEVALNYVSLRNAQSRLAIARRNLGYQDETVEIAGWRARAGLVSALDVEQAKAQRAQTAATIPSLETSLATAGNRLAVLLGEAPGALQSLVNSKADVPRAPDVIDAGLPADLLQRRPDLVSAERSLAAALLRIGVAEAELYPAVRLTGSLNTSSLSLFGLGESIVSSLAAGVTAPIFQGGRIRAQIDSAKGGADVAFASYRKAVLSALEDVENALTALANNRTRAAQLAQAEEAASTANLYARSQYRAGVIDFQKLLEAERSLLSAQDNRASAQADRATAAIQLYKALGGGWQNAPLPATAAPTTDKRPL